MHRCHIKKGIKALPLEVVIWILYFLLFVSSALCLSVVWAWICACLKAVLWICPYVCLSLCTSVCFSVCVYVCVCLCYMSCMSVYIPNKGFALYLLNSTENTTWGKEWNALQKSFTEFPEGFNHWLRLITTNPDDEYHCLPTNIHKWLLSTFTVDFRKFISASVFAAFSQWHTITVLGQGQGWCMA